MAYYSKVTLLDNRTEQFLKYHGFTNVNSCSHKSVWINGDITLYLNRDEVFLDIQTLFCHVFAAGKKHGAHELKQNLKTKIEIITNEIFGKFQ